MDADENGIFYMFTFVSSFFTLVNFMSMSQDEKRIKRKKYGSGNILYGQKTA